MSRQATGLKSTAVMETRTQGKQPVRSSADAETTIALINRLGAMPTALGRHGLFDHRM